MYREIVKWPSSSLKKVSPKVDVNTEFCSTVVADLKDTFRVKDGYGLAAPQIGYSARVIVINPSLIELASEYEHEDQLIMINPVVKHFGEPVMSRESCFSVPDLSEVVFRYPGCSVEFISEDGNKKSIKNATGLAAFCIQHEVDHLDGTLFIERASKLKRRIILKKLKKTAQRKEQARVLAQKEFQEDMLIYDDPEAVASKKYKPRSEKQKSRAMFAKMSRKKNRKKK